MKRSLSSIALSLALASGIPAWAGDVSFQIDMAQDVHAISPYIYGLNLGGTETPWAGAAHRLSFARFGGNRLTAYNWENNASNAGTDWFNQNDGYLEGGDTPGEAVRARVSAAHQGSASILLTIPLIDHVAADKNGDGDVNQSPNYLSTRFKRNYPKKPGPFAYPPDTGDGAVYQDEMVAWLKTRFPYADSDPTRRIFYALDNEPDLWMYTHPRVHPAPVTYAELFERSIATAGAIKSANPATLIFGPVNYGFSGYVNLQGAPDAAGRDFLNTYLDQMRAAEQTAGRRLIDVLDLHWYPEAHDSQWRRITADESDGDLAQARMQAPRSLWDPSYVEASWIANDYLGGPIQLLPRIKQQIAAHYPGTRLAITEYYYGGGAHISGALAQADVLGVFGREDLFAANLWHLGNTDDRYIYAGFALFRNYDGQGSQFGDTSVRALSSNNADTSVYASRHSEDAAKLTLLAINRGSQTVNGSFAIGGGTGFGEASPYMLTGSGTQIQAKPPVAVSEGRFSYSLPPLSATVFRLSASEPQPNQPPQANAGPDQSVNAGSLVVLPGSGTDSDGTIAAYAWRQLSGPGVSLSNAGTANASFTAPQVGSDTSLSFELRVTDDDGASATDSVSVLVKPASGMSFSNTKNYAIPDRSSSGTRYVTSPIRVSRSGPSGTINVHVKIVHARRGDLRLDLIRPDGLVSNLQMPTGESGADLEKDYSLNLSKLNSAKTWYLKITDTAIGNTGYLDEWSLRFP